MSDYTHFDSATIRPRKIGFALVWGDYMARATTTHTTRTEAREAYYIQVAFDYLGDAIRDNTRAEKIHMGRGIERHGITESGQIDWPSKS